ncbi:hypothetical protein [Gluconacetobacter takamatsuzukensis]|uniref:FlgN protein n=1 Tax=Gluconacetobacter takamatsuzukensis TaxID=1286190 RepID=A0A7W4PPG2_9PROT|nr:hypothetical protein [Gluconacetobacter takamatsuzukensis]MBB2203589.1 hypothetical protein [Gluconacetobacter takamatsuzukensis]
MIFQPDRKVASLLNGFQKVCVVLEKENELLKTGRIRDVVDMLPHKRKQMEALERLLSSDRADAGEGAGGKHPLMTPETEKAAARFGTLARLNRTLLENAIDAQHVLIRLIVVDNEPDSTTGYGASGQYLTKNGPQMALQVRSDA